MAVKPRAKNLGTGNVLSCALLGGKLWQWVLYTWWRNLAEEFEGKWCILGGALLGEQFTGRGVCLVVHFWVKNLGAGDMLGCALSDSRGVLVVHFGTKKCGA